MAYNLDLFALVGKLNGGSWYLSSPVVMIFGRKKKMKIFGGWSRRTRMCKEKHLRRSQQKADNTPCFPHSSYEPSKNGINKLLKLLYLFKHLLLRWLSSARYSAYIVYNTARATRIYTRFYSPLNTRPGNLRRYRLRTLQNSFADDVFSTRGQPPARKCPSIRKGPNV